MRCRRATATEAPPSGLFGSATVSQPPRTPALDDATTRALNAINRGFYREQAASFDETRRHAWPGWEPLLELLPDVTPLRVLDVGCGNGRFCAYLFTARSELHYVGIDASSALLEKARQRGAPGLDAQYKEADLIEVDLAAAVDGERFDLVVYFGLLHHLPGLARRRRLLQTGAGLLAAGGILAFTCWQFKSFERFQQRILPWDEFSDEAIGPIDPGQLEPGDHLLRWADGGSVRYCHFANQDEIRNLVDSLPGETVASYRADGRKGDLNRYLVIRIGS